MKAKKIRQNKRDTRVFAWLFCIALTVVITANAYSQSVEPNLRVVISSTVSGSSEKEMTAKDSFKVGEAVQIEVEIANLSNEVVEVPEGIVYSRPTLFSNGQQIPYHKEASERFKKGKYITHSRNILPNKSQSETLSLSDYYESLEPGQYQLSLERRFFKVGGTDIYIESNAVTFEVVSCGKK
jgi:hypothetical protein